MKDGKNKLKDHSFLTLINRYDIVLQSETHNGYDTVVESDKFYYYPCCRQKSNNNILEVKEYFQKKELSKGSPSFKVDILNTIGLNYKRICSI